MAASLRQRAEEQEQYRLTRALEQLEEAALRQAPPGLLRLRQEGVGSTQGDEGGDAMSAEDEALIAREEEMRRGAEAAAAERFQGLVESLRQSWCVAFVAPTAPSAACSFLPDKCSPRALTRISRCASSLVSLLAGPRLRSSAVHSSNDGCARTTRRCSVMRRHRSARAAFQLLPQSPLPQLHL